MLLVHVLLIRLMLLHQSHQLIKLKQWIRDLSTALLEVGTPFPKHHAE